mmetsp:Transcript_34155/g.85723  ORF Transcript_34155/g.85723 Transcript_34155/m.85723 type:complete len:720 (-) Transcript_34155:34-2193(-)
MGNGPSLTISPAEANALFSAAERKELEVAFVRMCGSSQSARPLEELRLRLAEFQSNCGVANAMLAQRVFTGLRRSVLGLTKHRRGTSSSLPALSFQQFVCGCAMATRASLPHRAHFCYYTLDAEERGKLNHAGLIDALRLIVTVALFDYHLDILDVLRSLPASVSGGGDPLTLGAAALASPEALCAEMERVASVSSGARSAASSRSDLTDGAETATAESEEHTAKCPAAAAAPSEDSTAHLDQLLATSLEDKPRMDLAQSMDVLPNSWEDSELLAKQLSGSVDGDEQLEEEEEKAKKVKVKAKEKKAKKEKEKDADAVEEEAEDDDDNDADEEDVAVSRACQPDRADLPSSNSAAQSTDALLEPESSSVTLVERRSIGKTASTDPSSTDSKRTGHTSESDLDASTRSTSASSSAGLQEAIQAHIRLLVSRVAKLAFDKPRDKENPAAPVHWPAFRTWVSCNQQFVEFLRYVVLSVVNPKVPLPKPLRALGLPTPPTLVGGNTDILTPRMLIQMRKWLGPELADCSFTCHYTSRANGFSLNTLHTHLAETPHEILTSTFVVVQDTHGYIFGMFASEAWRRTNSTFYGSEECFVFQLHPDMQRYSCDPNTPRGRNCMYSKMNKLAMGGEVDFFALELDDGFLNGRSNRCETFHSPCLSKKSQFRIRAVECWGLVTPDYLEILRMKYARFKEENTGKSVLDRQEDVFFLDLLGKGYSHLQRD